MPRPQFTLRALLVAMLAVACFFGGIRFERERRRREDEEAQMVLGGARVYPIRDLVIPPVANAAPPDR